ncbi:hypothetical protein [Modestobacter sp. DSM 44400]|uniref:hypothetical protein n=1 Tax=Modestobacter sp. DSM 44400 TaxID=1550230 RepID=UPI000B80A7D4|nr:hypothetical protein [Modestobacter sp. DSM 44400]
MYEALFTRSGAGGVVDYWQQVTYGTLDLTGSRVFGWLPMSHGTAEIAEIADLTFPGDRARLAAWGREAAHVAGIDLTPYRSVLVVQNRGPDHGATASGDVVIVHTDPGLCEFGFICHEMGRGFGLPHSYAHPDIGYGDGWDLMSFASTTFQCPIAFRGASGAATVGLNAHNLLRLDVIDPSRRWTLAHPDVSATVVLDPLNQPAIGSRGALVLELLPSATRPARPDGSTWTSSSTNGPDGTRPSRPMR